MSLKTTLLFDLTYMPSIESNPQTRYVYLALWGTVEGHTLWQGYFEKPKYQDDSEVIYLSEDDYYEYLLIQDCPVAYILDHFLNRETTQAQLLQPFEVKTNDQ